MQQVIFQISKNVLKAHSYISRSRFLAMIPLPKVITRKILLEFLKRLICVNLEKKNKSSNRSLHRSDGTMILWIILKLLSGNYLTQYQIYAFTIS